MIFKINLKNKTNKRVNVINNIKGFTIQLLVTFENLYI